MTLAIAAAVIALVQGGDVRTGRTDSGIAYDVQGQGPAVVLITGSNLDRRMWTAEAAWLRLRHTVVRYDLRAHGASETATVPFTHIDDLFAVLDDLRLERATLIGLSAGSTIALDAALLAPHRVDRLVLAAPAIGGYVPKERPAFFNDLIAALQARDFARAQEVMLQSPLFDVPAESRTLVRAMVTDNNRLWTIPRELLEAPSRPAADRLTEIAQPVLVLVGDRDLPAQREQAEVLGSRLRRGRTIVIPEGGHMLNLTSAARFREAVTAFLEGGAH